jgi:hypothetical protein
MALNIRIEQQLQDTVANAAIYAAMPPQTPDFSTQIAAAAAEAEATLTAAGVPVDTARADVLLAAAVTNTTERRDLAVARGDTDLAAQLDAYLADLESVDLNPDPDDPGERTGQ